MWGPSSYSVRPAEPHSCLSKSPKKRVVRKRVPSPLQLACSHILSKRLLQTSSGAKPSWQQLKGQVTTRLSQQSRGKAKEAKARAPVKAAPSPPLSTLFTTVITAITTQAHGCPTSLPVCFNRRGATFALAFDERNRLPVSLARIAAGSAPRKRGRGTSCLAK